MKAVSPVIATVIIVAVAIAISIAVALWITGLTSSFTGIERLDVQSFPPEKINDSAWNIYIYIKNTGTKDATIDAIFINGKNISDIHAAFNKTSEITSLPAPIKQGETKKVVITIVSDKNKAVFTSGQTLNIVVHTASGGQYPTQANLP